MPPTLTQRRVLESANKEYEHRDVREFARQASIQEAECYANRHQQPYVLQPTKPRVVEICELGKKMNFRRLVDLPFALDSATRHTWKKILKISRA